MGISLLETLVALALLAALQLMALPSLDALLDRIRVRAASADLQSALVLARAQAMRLRTRVDVVPLQAADWAQGWLVLVDVNRNHRLDPGETLLYRSAEMPPGLRIQAVLRDPKPYLAFYPGGQPRSHASSALPQIGALHFIAGRERRKLIISFLGRVRICDPVRDAVAC